MSSHFLYSLKKMELRYISPQEIGLLRLIDKNRKWKDQKLKKLGFFLCDCIENFLPKFDPYRLMIRSFCRGINTMSFEMVHQSIGNKNEIKTFGAVDEIYWMNADCRRMGCARM